MRHRAAPATRPTPPSHPVSEGSDPAELGRGDSPRREPELPRRPLPTRRYAPPVPSLFLEMHPKNDRLQQPAHALELSKLRLCNPDSGQQGVSLLLPMTIPEVSESRIHLSDDFCSKY